MNVALGVCFAVCSGGWVKLPHLKPVRVTLETSNLVRKYAHVVSEKIPFITKTPLILLIPAIFFCKKPAFFVKNKTLLKGIARELYLKFFNSVFSFCKMKGYFY